MKRLEDVIDCVKYGSILIIKQNHKNNEYEGTIIRQDGKIFDDVLSVEIGKFLNLLPNIKNEIDKGYIYHALYNFEPKTYQSSIIDINNNKYTNIASNQIIDEFQVLSNSVLDSMIELDTKIATEKAKKKSLKHLLKTKVLRVVS